MYIINDIAYAGNKFDMLKIKDIKIISELCMLVLFSNGEKRIFDATALLKYPIYEKLKNFEIFKKAYVENGVIVWNNGEIDIAPEAVYENSFEYEEEIRNIV